MPLRNLIDTSTNDYTPFIQPLISLLSSTSLEVNKLLYINCTLTVSSVLLRLYQFQPQLIESKNVIQFIKSCLTSTFPALTILSIVTGLIETTCKIINGKRISIDPKFLTNIYSQLESEEVQIDLLKIIEEAAAKGREGDVEEVFRCLEIIGSSLPLTLPFLTPICTFTNSVLTQYGSPLLRQSACKFLTSIYEIEEPHIPRERVNKKNKGVRQKMPCFNNEGRIEAAVMVTEGCLRWVVEGLGREVRGNERSELNEDFESTNYLQE